MTGIEEVLREALTRAQDGAPLAEEMFTGVVRRRRRHRRNVAVIVVAAVATIVAIVVPVSLGVTASPRPTGPTHDLHRTPTPIGDVTGQWILDEMGSSAVVGDHAFVAAATDKSLELIRVGDDGVRRLPLPSSLLAAGGVTLASTSGSLFVVSPGDDSGGAPVLKVDPDTFVVTAQVVLPAQAERAVTTDTALYVMGGNNDVLKLDPQTLAVVRHYQVLKANDAYSLGGMERDGDGMDVIGAAYRRPSWKLRLSSDLRPVGSKRPVSGANLGVMGTACGDVTFQTQGTRNTVYLSWPDHRIKPFVAGGRVDAVAPSCPARAPAYLLVTSDNTTRVERTDVKPDGTPVVAAIWTPDPMLPFTGLTLSGRDLWLFGPTIVRVRLPAGP